MVDDKPAGLNRKIDDLTVTVNRLSQQFQDYVHSIYEADEVGVYS